jgi:Tyrosine phosphatase family
MPLLDTNLESTVAPFLHRLRGRKTRKRLLLPSILRGGCTALALAAMALGFRLVAADNLRTVEPGRCYRAAQMSPARLETVLHELGIHTVVNLRGYCPDFEWYCDECRVTHAAGVSQEDITLSAIRLPSPSELRRLVEVLDHSACPMLLHCRQGVDRTGLAAVIVKLLQPGITLAGAERQLSLAFGYVPFNGTEHMRLFFDLYREWLDRLKLVHSPELFRHWASREYCPGACRGKVEFPDLPASWPAGRPRVVRVRVANSSVRTWVMRPGVNQGVHLRYRVDCLGGGNIVAERAGLLDAQVEPGQSIEFDLGVPALPRGDYILHVDLIDSDQNAFSQFDIEPAVHRFRVAAIDLQE